MLNKKGISPLIATVLIIGFTIVIAVLVISFINNIVGNQKDRVDCTNEALSKCYNANSDITYSAKYGEFGGPYDNADAKAKVTNSGKDPYLVIVSFLDDNEVQQRRQEMEVPAGASLGFTDVFTTSTKVKFSIKTSATVGEIECTEICGSGEIIEIA